MVKNLPDPDEPVTDFTRYEKARMIGSRALQISMGAPFQIKLSEEDLEKVRYDPIKIARMEFDMDVLPITVKRPKPKFRETAKK